MFKAARKIIYLLLLSTLFTGLSKAQSGFDAIKNNDFIEAKRLFTAQLEKDSTNLEGLRGMIIMSELSQEYLPYGKYLNTLLRNHRDPYTFAMFSYIYQGDNKSLEKFEYPDWVTIKNKINEAIDWGNKNRDRNQVWQKYNAIIPKVKWSMIGPFRNINGSGYVTPHAIENEPYNDSKIFTNDKGIELSWGKPAYTAATGRIIFSQHLPDAGWGDDAIYYANTFVQLDADQTIQLHIGRTAPIKIWINDILLFTNDHSFPFYYDLEVLEVRLKKGNNRILIKNATNKNQGEGNGSLNFYDGNSYDHDMLSIRFTDVLGKPLTNLVSNYSVDAYNNDRQPIQASVTSNSFVEHFIQQAVANNDIWSDYCLMKAYLSENYIKDGEAHFYQRNKEKSGIVLYNYLFAKMCQFNGKTEKVYEQLSKIDEKKTPIFGILYEKIQDINLDTDPEKYLAAVENLARISPSNLNLINSFIDYYNKTGKQVEKDTFIYQCIRKYPEYKEELEDDLSNYKEKEERYGPEETIKAQKKSIKNLKTGSNDDDYDNAIEYYKDRKKKDKVMAMYREKIYYSPHYAPTYNDYGAYLKEIANYTEAKSILNTSLQLNPYQSGVYESLGDISRLEGNNEEALTYYIKGSKLGSSGGMFGYYNGIDEKIEQLRGSVNYKQYFKTPTFDETLNNPEWQLLAENEDAMVLQYTKDAVLDSSNKVQMYQSLMIKILKESGIEKYNEIDMGFMGSITSAKVIKADGTESTPEKSGSYIVIKNLEVNDLIQVESHDILDAETIFGKYFNHQHFIFFPDPVYYSKFDFAVKKGVYVGYRAHKMDKTPKIYTDAYNNEHYVWENKNLSKLQDETAFPDYYDYYRNIIVSTLQSWGPVNDWYEQTTYKRTELTYEVKEVLDTLIKPGMSDEVKVQKIYNFITTKIRYSYVPFLNTRFVPKWPGNTLSAGIGDCKDVATLMITMLRSQGIESYYTLVKTSQFNHLEAVPSLTFDHVIVCYILDGKKRYCDLTTNFYPLYVLPEMDNDAVALLIKPGEKETFHLPNDMLNAEKTNSKYTINASFTGDRDLSVNVQCEYSGTAGGNMREMIFRTAKNKYSDFISQYFGQDVFENGIYSNIEFLNLEDFSNPLQVKYSLSGIGFADKVSGLYIIRMPYLEAIKKNQVITETDRSNRVDMEKILNIYPSEQTINLTFPKGYKLAEIPQNINHKSAFSMYSVQFKPTPDGLQIIKKQQFYKNIIEISEFEAFKADYLKLLDLDKFKVALLKK